MNYWLCKTCHGSGSLPAPNRRWWQWWERFACHDCMGDGHARPPKRRAELAEIDRLRQFRDRVLAAMTEHATCGQPYVYIWQSEWDRIKAECGEPTDERKDGDKCE